MDRHSPSLGAPVARGGAAALTRNVLILTVGTLGSQVLLVASAPLLTRLYSPDDLGIFALYLAVVSLSGAVACWRYELAIPLPKEDEDALRLLSISLLAATITGLAIGTFAAIVSAAHPPALVSLAGVAGAPWLLAAGTCGIGWHQALTYWAVRKNRPGPVALGRLLQSAGLVGTQMAASPFGALGLAAGLPVGRVLGIGALLAVTRPRLRIRDIQAVRGTLRRYAVFPLVTLWSSVLNVAGVHLPVVILSLAFDATVVGFFALTVRVLQAPAAVIGQAVAQAFYGATSQAGDDEQVKSYASGVYDFLLTIGAAPAIALTVTAPDVAAFVFGAEWRTAGEYAAWLVPWTLIVFASSPLSTTVFLRSRQRVDLLFQGLLLTARSVALLAGTAAGPLASVQAYGAVSAVLWAAYGAWLMNLNGVTLPSTIGRTLRELAASAAIAAPLVVAAAVHADPSWVLVGALTSAVAYIAYVVYRSVGIRKRWA